MKTISILLIVCLLPTQFILLAPLATAAATEKMADGRALNSEMLTLTIYGFTSTLYPGDASSFYIRAVNQYAGDQYLGTGGRPYNATYIYDMAVSIDGIVDEQRASLPDVPVIWNVSTLQNNNGMGWDLSQGAGVYIYADDLYNRDRFTVKTIDILPGKYNIRFKVTAQVMTNYDGIRYTFATCVDYDYIAFEVRSCLGPYTNFKYPLTGMTENDNAETLYSGAANEKVGISGLTSYSGTLVNITGILTVQSNHISVQSATAFSARTGGSLSWRIDIDRDTPAGYYDVGLKFSYRRNDVPVTERATVQTILVQYTPLLGFPNHNNMNLPAVTLVQNSPRSNFSIYVQNIGNVDLMNVVVRLDLDSAAYFQGGELYWNENSYAGVSATDASVNLGEILTGGGRQAYFDDLTLKNNLPPGKYLIPVDYSASYHSDGSLRSSGDVITGGWDEKGYNDYNSIMKAISDPEPLTVGGPGICVLVQDDARGLDLEGQLGGVYYAGSSNNYFSLTVTNRERYALSDVRYTISTGPDSPLKNPGAPDADPLAALPAIGRPSLAAAGQDTLRFYADIKSTAGAGVRHLSVDVRGYNTFNVPVQATLDIPIILGARQPVIQSLRLAADMTSGRTGVVTLTVKNFGLGSAWNASAFFRPAGTAIKSVDDTVRIGDLAPDGTATVRFGVAPTGPEATLIGSHSGYIYYKYIDDSGTPWPLFGGGSEYISFEFNAKSPDLEVMLVDCPPVKANQIFTAHVIVKNIGGAAAENTSILLINPHSVFNLRSKSEVSAGTIAPGESQTLNFDFKAGPDLTDGTEYRFTLCFSYRRADGTAFTFSDGEKEDFSVRTKDIVNTSRQEQVVEYKGTGLQVDIGAILLGVFFLIGVVLLARALRRPPAPAASQPQPAPLPPVPPPSPPPQPAYYPPAPPSAESQPGAPMESYQPPQPPA
jgi:hypothetical protein